MGEYGIWGKFTNFDIALRSPLIIKTPNINKPGEFAEAIVETVDIFPTLADLCELPIPEYLEGKSMRSIIYDPVAKIKSFSVGERNGWGFHGVTIRNEQYRMMVWIDNTVGDTLDVELYDYSEDPPATTNIADDKPEVVEQMMQGLGTRL